MAKFASVWWPDGNWTAIYYVLVNPIYSRWAIDWGQPPWFQLTQLATVSTVLFEWCAWVLLPAYWFRFTHQRPGRLRALFNRIDVRGIYVACGLSLHLGIELFMSLGSFALAMLALYPIFLHPDEIEKVMGWLRERLGG